MKPQEAGFSTWFYRHFKREGILTWARDCRRDFKETWCSARKPLLDKIEKLEKENFKLKSKLNKPCKRCRL